MTINTVATITRADWGPAFHQAARNTAAVLVAVYTAGYVLGTWIHQLNDALAAMLRPSPAPMAPPAVHPLAELAAEFEACTVKQLQAMTGSRRKCRKAQLIAQLVSC